MPYARTSLAKGGPTLDVCVLPGLKGEFMTFVLSANRCAGDTVPIKKAPIDMIKVVLKAFMVSSSRAWLSGNQNSRPVRDRMPPSNSDSALSFKPSTHYS